MVSFGTGSWPSSQRGDVGEAPGRSRKRLGRTTRTVTDWRLSEDLSRETTVGGRDQQQELKSHDQLGRNPRAPTRADSDAPAGLTWLHREAPSLASGRQRARRGCCSICSGYGQDVSLGCGFDHRGRRNRRLRSGGRWRMRCRVILCTAAVLAGLPRSGALPRCHRRSSASRCRVAGLTDALHEDLFTPDSSAGRIPSRMWWQMIRNLISNRRAWVATWS
jgi:hypothetical protein